MPAVTAERLESLRKRGYRPWYVRMLLSGCDATDKYGARLLYPGGVYPCVQGAREIHALTGDTQIPIFSGEYAVLAWTLVDEHPIWGKR